MTPTRYAQIIGDADQIARYLPANYRLIPGLDQGDYHLIIGHDNAGWTLEDYVLPRLASGLHFAEIVKCPGLVPGHEYFGDTLDENGENK